jgi:hypothetical protein
MNSRIDEISVSSRVSSSTGQQTGSDKFPDVITTVGDEIGKKESAAVLHARLLLIKVYVQYYFFMDQGDFSLSPP